MIIKVRSGWRLVGNAILSHPVSNNAAQKSSFSENEKFSSSITKKNPQRWMSVKPRGFQVNFLFHDK